MNVAAIGLWLLLALFAGIASLDRRIGFWGGFFASLLLGPLAMIGILLLSAKLPQYE
jgi:hypothetical protein